MVTFSAPGRAGILGNPSDIYGGQVLACGVAARNRCRLTVTKTEEGPEDPRLWTAARGRFVDLPPVRVEWSGDVPRSSGLAGSTALLTATLGALRAMTETGPTGTGEFAEFVRDVERRDAGIVCGYQDAHMTVRGGLRLLDFAGKHPDTDGGPLPNAAREEWEAGRPLPFLLVTTGVRRLSGAVHAPVIDRWRAGDPFVRAAITEIGEMAEVGWRRLRAGRVNLVGAMMTRSHELVREMGGTGESVDRLVADCVAEGALGAKLAGAGGGGTVIATTEDPDGLERRLRTRGYERFLRLDPHGPGLLSETG